MMQMTRETIDPAVLSARLIDGAAGAYVAFEGWVRNENEGRKVQRLEYESFEPLAEKEGLSVLEEARAKFAIIRAACMHRTGLLEIGECAVWVGVSAPHRDEAFAACRFIIDQVKVRLPIWKKEHYTDGDSGWVNCERCAIHGESHEPREASGR